MATITFQLVSTPLNGSIPFSGTDADMQTLLNWAAVAYKQQIYNFYVPSGVPPIDQFTPTNTQIGATLARQTVNAWNQAAQKMKKDSDVAAVPTPPPMGWS